MKRQTEWTSEGDLNMNSREAGAGRSVIKKPAYECMQERTF